MSRVYCSRILSHALYPASDAGGAAGLSDDGRRVHHGRDTPISNARAEALPIQTAARGRRSFGHRCLPNSKHPAFRAARRPERTTHR